MVKEQEVTDLVTVRIEQGMLRANVIRGVLESAGIPVILKYEAIGPAIGLTVNGIGRVEIRVPSRWEKEARDLLTAEPRPGEIFSVPPDVKKEQQDK